MILLVKAPLGFVTCLLVNNNLWGKLVLLLPIIFDDNFKTTPVSFFIADFNLLSYEFDSFTFNPLYCVIFILIKIESLNRIVYTKLLECLVKSQNSFLCFFKNEIDSGVSCSI